MKIGNIVIEKTAALAPMASVADHAYRQMCKKYGAASLVGEMCSAKGLVYALRKNAERSKSAALLHVTPDEFPMGVQLFGSDPHMMALACKKAVAFQPQFIDINMGCPVQKVIKTGAGSALMKTPRLAAEIASACVDAVDIPITAKIRKGFDDNTITAVETAVLLQQAGVCAITVHGRTRQQMYAPPVDIDIITAVKQAVDIPVIGNGDVTSPQLVQEMYQKTGCDLVMIGRGSYGRPWIFEEISAYLAHGVILPPKALSERMEIMLEHVSLACADKGEKVAVRESRKLVSWYVKGVQGAAKLRAACGTLETYADVKAIAQLVLNTQSGDPSS